MKREAGHEARAPRRLRPRSARNALRAWRAWLPHGEMPRRAVLVRLILALALATGLWVGVSSAEDPVRTVTYSAVPVLVSFPTGYYATKLPPAVTVRVEGLASDLDGALPPTGFVDLTHASVTSRRPMSAPVQMRGLPDRVRLLSVTPRTVTLQLEIKKSKDVPVLVQVTNAPLGYEVVGYSVTPTTVSVTGPSHVINDLLAARVVVDASRLTRTTTRRYEPAIFDRTGQPVSRRIVLVKPSDVSVTIQVRLQQVEHLAPVRPSIAGLVATGYGIISVVPSPALVQIIGSTQVPATTTLTTRPINITGWTTSHIVLAQLIVPSPLRLRYSTQATVLVTIDVAPFPGSAVTTALVQVVGLRPGDKVTLDSSTVTVAYEGGLPRLRSAPAPRAILDLRDRSPGVYHLAPTITLGPSLSLLALTPPRLRVVISGPPPPPTIMPRPHPTATPHLTGTSRPRPSATPQPQRSPRPRGIFGLPFF